MIICWAKCISSRPLSSSPLLTDAQKSHNPWGRPGLCRRGIIQVWGIMTPLSLRLCAEAPLGPCQFQALQFGWIYQWRSLPHHYTLFLISLSPPYALFELIIPHCGNHKKRGSYLIFTWGHFLRVDFSFFFFTNGSQLCFPLSVVLSSFFFILSPAHTRALYLTLFLPLWCVGIIGFSCEQCSNFNSFYSS